MVYTGMAKVIGLESKNPREYVSEVFIFHQIYQTLPFPPSPLPPSHSHAHTSVVSCPSRQSNVISISATFPICHASFTKETPQFSYAMHNKIIDVSKNIEQVFYRRKKQFKLYQFCSYYCFTLCATPHSIWCKKLCFCWLAKKTGTTGGLRSGAKPAGGIVEFI